MEIGYIYKLILNTDIENFKTGEIYIGKHNGKRSKSYFSGGKLIQKILKKYGKEVFDREIICNYIDDEPLLQYLEKYYIKKYNCNRYISGFGLNLSDGGEGVKGNKMSEESIEKMRKVILESYRTGRRTPPRCKAVYQYNLETGEFIRKYDSIKEAAEEMQCYRESIGFAANNNGSCRGYAWDYNKLDNKLIYENGKVGIYQYDLEGNFIKEWKSAKDAAFHLKVSKCSITNCCRGRSKTSHGFIWKWKSTKNKINMKSKELEINNIIEINDSNPYILLAVYGTLRLNQGNYNAILKDNSEYLGTYLSEKSFQMYGLHNGFPIVCDHGNTAIEYDLFRVTDPQVLRRVHSLEGCTGIPGHSRNWYDIQAIKNEDHGIAYMYIQHQEFEKDNIIESGNWLTRHEQ